LPKIQLFTFPIRMSTSLKWKLAQFAEIRWWQNYLKSKSATDYKAYKTDYWKKFLNEIEPDFSFKPEDKILDAGCGPAGLFIILNQNETTAVDPLLGKYEENLSHFSKSNYPNVNFVESGLEGFVEDEAFDHVFCLNCINHVADLPKSLNNLVDSTKKGGKIYMSIDAHNHQALKHLFRAVPLDILHPHQYDLAEYKTMLTSRGCEIKQEIRYNKRTIFDYYLLIAEKI
jgi:2-polyprenyl-3-methyl-5-hydroxy-6-metoxy-1,4-benzoquinol methylase